MKYMDTSILKRWNEDAIRKGRNQFITTEGLARLNPNGKHLVFQALVHKADELRCVLYLKVRGRDEPVVACLDMGIDDYEKLPDTDDLKEAKDENN